VTRSPLLGEHTDEILQELGFKIDDLIDLRHKKVI
jgi:formyl-CoA transferase